MQAIRVLLVDDEPIFVEALRALLDRDERVEVVGAAGDGARALELAGETSPDVALVDLALPGMDGFELTRRLRDAAPALRVLAVSGLSHERDVTRALDAGASAFLFKGGLHDDLLDAIVDGRGERLH